MVVWVHPLNIKFNKEWIKKTLLHNLKNYVATLKVPKNCESGKHKLMFKQNYGLKMAVYNWKVILVKY